jgi:hypothetical protein
MWTLVYCHLISTLTVRGSLIWDTTVPNLELRAYGIVVEEGGLLQIGSLEACGSLQEGP